MLFSIAATDHILRAHFRIKGAALLTAVKFSLEDRLQVTAHAQTLTLYTSFEGRGCFRKRELKGGIQFDYVYLVLRTREKFEAMGSRLSRPQPIEVQNKNALTSADVRAYFPRTNVFFV